MKKTKTEIRKALWDKRKIDNLCVYCGNTPPSDDKIGCVSCLAKKVKLQDDYGRNHRDRTALYRKRIKKEAIDKYGGVCACCGITELMFLTIDHKNNDGGVERKGMSNGRNSVSSTQMYMKLIREEKRDDIQVLCFNCNMGRAANGGICPHHNPSLDSFEFDLDLRTVKKFNKGVIIDWPNDEELIKQCNEIGIPATANVLKVQADTIRKRLNRRNKYQLVTTKYKKDESANVINEVSVQTCCV